MGGHHGPKLPEIPDWRIYRVEDSPDLMKVKKQLAFHGLSDPWLRNEVWKFTEYKNKQFTRKFFLLSFSRGFKYGLIAAVLTAAAKHLLFNSSEEKHGHH